MFNDHRARSILRGITESPQGDGFDPDFETLFAKELKRRGLEGSSSDSESKASTSQGRSGKTHEISSAVAANDPDAWPLLRCAHAAMLPMHLCTRRLHTGSDCALFVNLYRRPVYPKGCPW